MKKSGAGQSASQRLLPCLLGGGGGARVWEHCVLLYLYRRVSLSE